MTPSSGAMTRRSYPGRKVLLVCAAFVAVLGGVAGWVLLSERPRTGAYIDVLALDGEYGVAIRHERTRGRAYVELFGTEEGLRWQALVPRYQVAPGAVGVAASDGAITVRFPRDGRTQIFGFGTLTAQKLGTVTLGHDLPREADGHLAPTVATLSGGLQSFEVIEPDGGPTRVYALAMTAGKIAWEIDLPTRGVDGMWLTPTHLVVAQPGVITALDRGTGAAWSQAGTGACVTGDGVFVAAERGVFWLGLADQQVRGSTAPATQIGPCGGDGDAAWVRTGVGTTIWAPAGGAPAAPVVAMRVAATAGDDGAARLAGVDVRTGAEAWTTAALPALRDAALVPAGDVVLVRLGDTLVSIDVATGAARAVAVPGARPLQPHHVAKGHVWLVTDGGLTSLDARTLTVRGTWRGGRAPSDASHELSALGLRTSG